jgi:hypothetical protein
VIELKLQPCSPPPQKRDGAEISLGSHLINISKAFLLLRLEIFQEFFELCGRNQGKKTYVISQNI